MEQTNCFLKPADEKPRVETPYKHKPRYIRSCCSNGPINSGILSLYMPKPAKQGMKYATVDIPGWETKTG